MRVDRLFAAARKLHVPRYRSGAHAAPIHLAANASRAQELLLAFNGSHAPSCHDKRRPDAFDRLGIIGAGAWGTALALAAHRAGRRSILWAHEEWVVESIACARRNPFLPSTPLPEVLTATTSLHAAVHDADVILLACPSQHVRRMARRCHPLLAPGIPIVICSKGIEAASGALMSTIVEDEMRGRPYGVLSGPSFAEEVARGLPTAVTIAAPLRRERMFHRDQLAARLAATLGTPTFRPYLADDVIGVEVGGAVKNVLAIACGIAAGRDMGSNARAAIITRGLAEMTRLTLALGGRAETLCGLAGVGDLLLTCSSEQSRNFSYGRALGQGRRPSTDDAGVVVEGKVNAPTIAALARAHDISMPICQAVCDIIEGRSIDDAITRLLMSDLRPEPLGAEGEIRIPQAASPALEWEFASE